VWIRLIWLRIGEVAACCEYAFEHSGSTKYDEFLDKSNVEDSQSGLLHAVTCAISRN